MDQKSESSVSASSKQLNPSEECLRFIKKLNKIYTKNLTPEALKTSEEKYKKILYNCLDHLSNLKQNEVTKTIKALFTINKEFLLKTGDEIVDKLWKLYDLKSFTKGEINLLEKTPVTDMINLFLLFKHKTEFETLFELSKELKIIQKSDFDTNIDKCLENLNLSCKTEGELKNTLIDFFILFIFANVELKSFYTSISSFLMSTESNVILLFKTIALFGLSLAQITKKEDFLPSVLYLIGGVLRTHAKSYLKSKGIMKDNLFENNQCKKHTHGHHPFEAKIITTLECDFLEQYFFPIMLSFLKITTTSIDYSVKLDTFSVIFLKNLEMGELDFEDSLPPNIVIMHTVILFLNDFMMSFITNFAINNSSNNIQTKFSHFESFINYAVSFLAFSCHNVNTVFSLSDRKKHILGDDCEKVEYRLKDIYNHYGVCLMFYYIWTGKYQLISPITGEKVNSLAISSLISRNIIDDMMKASVIMFLSTETSYSIGKDLRFVSYELFEAIFNNFNSKDENSFKMLYNLLFELTQVESMENDINYVLKILELSYLENPNKLFKSLVDFCKNKLNFVKVIIWLNRVILNNSVRIRVNENDVLWGIKKCVLNGWMLDENVVNNFVRFVEENHKAGNTKKDVLNGLIEGFEKELFENTSFKDEEKELVKNNYEGIKERLLLFKK